MQLCSYVSELDELLIKLEKELPKSSSRILEEEKSNNISLLRDQLHSAKTNILIALQNAARQNTLGQPEFIKIIKED